MWLLGSFVKKVAFLRVQNDGITDKIVFYGVLAGFHGIGLYIYKYFF